ncbi:hypothetical protein [Streptomyces luteireticuli]|uniref:hypothetical protein n=1 Tax=Streptomyces luteireticuli TaxID=173858 RepID=UPI00355882AE
MPNLMGALSPGNLRGDADGRGRASSTPSTRLTTELLTVHELKARQRPCSEGRVRLGAVNVAGHVTAGATARVSVTVTSRSVDAELVAARTGAAVLNDFVRVLEAAGITRITSGGTVVCRMGRGTVRLKVTVPSMCVPAVALEKLVTAVEGPGRSVTLPLAGRWAI